MRINLKSSLLFATVRKSYKKDEYPNFEDDWRVNVWEKEGWSWKKKGDQLRYIY